MTGFERSSYEDFLVNEIDQNGRVVRLTDTETLPVDVTTVNEDLPEEEIRNQIREQLQSVLDKVETESIFEFIDKTPVELHKQSSLKLSAPLNKEERTMIHKALKRLPVIYSQTDGDFIVIKFNSNRNQQKPRKFDWPESR